ncbi:efflux transporter outer membrane subunit [Piscinibacter sakaiensis]|uniref:RND efflux system, outer membrane lipoprotein CmeC n=1 Tax=Piscinibacter sakaiensis TaxID=1547922 RepID=A0A0K8NUL6_PISS1|nr:efflux transporter outer membrane subunit [Piscinibacter sakaiensis]GAP34063.1 RND efflux system, outer membrane lipoprotein CmeC [Piscinibacter sakaiensis]
MPEARPFRSSPGPVALVAALILAGCAAVGPDHQRPAPALDASFIQPGSGQPDSRPVSADIAAFWRGFNDGPLTALVDAALAANGDVRIAQARLQEARAGLGEAEAAGRPGAGFSGSAERAVQPLTQRPGTSREARTGNTLDASFIANWEIDLFGGIRRGREGAAARVDASEAGLGAAHTAVAAEVARNYLELRGLQQRRQVAEQALEKQREALRITQLRADAGRGTELDLARARGLVAATEASLPALDGAAERAMLRLATLSARPPRALMATLAAPAPLPSLPVTDLGALPVGTPQAWLQRRPDLVAAERELAAATADIGVARAALYPRLSLSGLLGFNAATGSGLLEAAAGRWALGAGITWTPLDGGALRARVKGSEARAQQSLARFEQTLAVALEETEGAFSSFTRETQRAAKLDEAARQAETASQLARLRFEAGVTDFLAVLDAEREALQQRDALVQAQVGTAAALVAVYRSLGGGWAAPEGASGR